MIKLLRLLQGYVLFVAEGGFVERFLNLCKINGISLWGIKNDGVKVKAFTSAKDFERISKAAERSGMTIIVEENRGLKTFAIRNKLRVGAFFGVLIAVLVTVYLSGCVWSVEIQQKEGVKSERFTNTLAELGVKTGARKSKIDILAVQDELLRRHSDLLWVSLNIFGGKAELEYTLVNEKTPSDETLLPTNIVAGKNGIVTLVECYRGTPLVKEGQCVVEGSVLISGVLTNADGTESLTQAKGKVYAKTENSISIVAEDEQSVEISIGAEPCYGISLFGADLPLGRADTNALSSTTRLSLMGHEGKLPVGFIRCDYLTLRKENIRPDARSQTLFLLLKCVEEKRAQFEGVRLKKVSYSVESQGQKTAVSVQITCVEDISEQKIISVEKN
ncbi:MAG: sporulation protein YqfD [Clostridia bacterium]|nr:sporulation protein YqfD [Clostridia bacterium]